MNRQQRNFTYSYIIIILIGLIILNWNSVSWIFSYRVMGELTHNFFNPYPNSNLLLAADDSNVQEPQNAANLQNLNSETGINLNNNQNTNSNSNNAVNNINAPKDGSLQIGKIGVTAPIVFSQSTDIDSLSRDLDDGVVYYPGSALPGQTGQIVVLGHSAPANWPKIKYDWVFSEITDLEAGSKITINFNGKKYTYSVIDKGVVDVGEDISVSELSGKNNILTLVSCWPPGKNYKRIVVNAELIN